MKALRTILWTAVLLCGTAVFAQEEHSLQLNAELRTRGEWRYGAMREGAKAPSAVFISDRTLLSLSYKVPGLELEITPKHAGIWGASGNGAFSLDEAWFRASTKGGLFLQLGRQKLSYDDQRIIGENDWTMAAGSHDVLRAGFERKRHQLHLILAFNQNNENVNGGTRYVDGGQYYKTMQTVWYHLDLWPWLSASLLMMNVGMQDLAVPKEDLTNWQFLYGAYLKARPGPFTLEASYYRQGGHSEYGLPIYAWMANADAAWKISPALTATTGYFYMSGDPYYYVVHEGAIGLVRKTEIRGFNPIFGSHHQFYGAMDFFYVSAFYGGNTPGLQDFHTGLKWNPTPKLSLETEYHFLATAVDVKDCKKALGHELELVGSWKFSKSASLMLGYSLMNGTETMKVVKRGSDDTRLHWAWLMVSVSPELFSKKW